MSGRSQPTHRPARRPGWRAALVTTAASLGLGACAISHSSIIEATSGEMGCRSSAGVYFLGRTYFNVQVLNLVTNGVNTEDYYLAGVTPVRRIDRDHGFCLNYRGSITAEEAFVVKKTPDGLLTQITSSSDDKSAQITKTLAHAFFVGVSGNAKFPGPDDIAVKDTTKTAIGVRVGGGDDAKVVDQTYDPDNDAETALLNNSIKDFGFCLVMEDQKFEGHYTSIDDYCDQPLRRKRIEKMLAKVSHTEGPLPSVYDGKHGIFYRPRQTRTVYLYLKKDLRRSGGWKLRASNAVPIENTAPIMFVGIDRTFFAKRETTALFDDGALTDVQIKKSSELVGFVSVPLYIAQSIVALPAQIVQVKIDTTNQREKLIIAQNELLKAEAALTSAQAAAQAKSAGGGSGDGTKSAGADEERRNRFVTPKSGAYTLQSETEWCSIPASTQACLAASRRCKLTFEDGSEQYNDCMGKLL